MAQNKELFSFIVNKNSFVKETKVEVVDGIEQEVSKKVLKPIRYNIIIKNPSILLVEEAQDFYSIQVGSNIQKGLIPRVLLAKKYNDQGGVISENEIKIYAKTVLELNESEMALARLSILADKTEEQEFEKNELVLKIAALKKKIYELEAFKEDIFSHCAETKAENKTIIWLALHLTQFHNLEETNDKPKALFEGDTYEEKFASYANKIEEEDEILSKSWQRIISFIHLWYHNYVSDKESFEKLEKAIQEDKNAVDSALEAIDARDE